MPNYAFGKKELWDLWVTVVLAFSLLGYHLADTYLAWLPPGLDRPIHHALCAWIFGVLWIAYRRWRQARLVVEDLETFLRSINTEAILVLDAKRRITLCNEAVIPIFGYTPAELLGQSTDLLYGDRRRNGDNPSEIRDTMDRRGFHIGTAKGKRKNGDIFDVEISSSLLRNREGAILVVRDVTQKLRQDVAVLQAKIDAESAHAAKSKALAELEAQHARLRDLENLRDSLTHMIVHDMRTPLQVIMTHAEMLQGPHGKGLYETSLPDVVQQTKLLMEMVNDLLDVGRLESGSFPIARRPGRADALVREASRLIAPIAEIHKVAVRTETEEVVASFDATLLQRVLVNLLTNAIKYSPENSVVDLTFRTSQAMLRFEITDRGPGIDPAHHSLIFEKFGQAGTCSKPSFQSTGLGLTFCKLAVEAHGGRIGVTSTPGNGATFWFEIPAIPVTATLQPA